MNKHLLTWRLVAFVWLIAPVTLQAQTALNTTTLSAAVTGGSSPTRTVTIASATSVAARDWIFVDREAMLIQSIDGTTLTVVRGIQGTAVAAHPNTALVYTGVPNRFYQNTPSGACTRTDEQFLPHIVLRTGEVWDCPVGTLPVWTLLNDPAQLVARSVWFNLDNGAGTTVDDVILRHPRPVRVTACRILYVDATTGTVAAGTAQVGITVAGAEVVAATAYANAVAVGTTTAMVIAAGAVGAGVPIIVRHTGVAVTQAGQAIIECDYTVR